MSQRISFVVQGKVQGVFFRDFTQKQATSYGITGWVKNTSDGKVKGEAQGEQSALEKFRKDLNYGPSTARVDKVETQEIATKDGEVKFTA